MQIYKRSTQTKSNFVKRSIFLVFLFFLCGGKAFSSPTAFLKTNDTYLSTTQLNNIEENALQGNGTAAIEAANYYEQLGELSLTEFWFSVSAENGEADNQFSYAQTLLMNDDTDSQIRSIFWMQLALKGANKPLKKYIASTLKQQLLSFLNDGRICDSGGTSLPAPSLVQNNSDSQNNVLASVNVEHLRVLSLCGDIDATRFLVIHYESMRMLRQSMYFTRLGAQNGDPVLQMKMAKTLSEQLSDQQAQIRARFWALRVLNQSTDSKLVEAAKYFLKSHGG